VVAFLGSLLTPEISESDEPRRKLKTSSFVDDSDYFPRMTSSEVVEILVSNSWASWDKCPIGKMTPETMSDPWTSIL
jgi:hypothetical protein